MQVSKRLTDVPPSAIRKLVPLATQAKKQGVKVYHLNIGSPDIETPDVMLQVLRNWDRKTIVYDESQGNPELLKSLAWYYQKLGYPFIKEEQIQVTLGGSEGIFMSMFGCLSSGDEIILFEPFFTTYNSYAVVAGIKTVPVLTTSDNGFHLPLRDEIEKKITSKTRAILYCSPNNPTGTVYTEKEVEMLVEIAKKHHLFLIADEVYREFCYVGKHTSLLNYMQDIPDQAVILDSLSKRYSLCGARLGMFVSLNSELMSGVLRIAQQRLSAGFIDQLMASKLSEVPQSYLDEVHDEYEARRDVVYEGLKKISGVKIPKPEGAFYAIVGLPIKNSEHFCEWLLTDFRDHDETVMLAPAPGFYATPGLGKNEVRIAYVINQKDLKRSMEIIKIALQKYPDV